MVEQLHVQNPIDALKAELSSRTHLDTCIPIIADITTAYAGQYTSTGQSCLEYVCAVAQTIIRIQLDHHAIAAALLAFLPCQREQEQRFLVERYGPETVRLRQEIHRIQVAESMMNKVSDHSVRYDQERIRKMLMSLVQDIRVVVITIAMHTEHLRYLAGLPLGPIHRLFAEAGLALYGPLANRLGIWQLKWPIEDLSFRFLQPENYQNIARQLQDRRTIRESFIEQAIRTIETEMTKEGIACKIQGRAKHIYSIYNKMCLKKLTFDQLYDLLAIRILVRDVKSCYATLGIVHNLWAPIPKEFDDYINQPKANLYQSLHTAVLVDGRPLEVQIRTYEMHEHAEMGVSAHWRYKERDTSGKLSKYNEKIALLRQLLMWQKDVQTQQPITQEALTEDIIYVFTPQYDVIDLKAGSTPLDFAYRIHTNLAHRCRGAKINGHIVPLNTALQSMDQIDIITTKDGGPSRDWLDPEKGFLKSHRARSKVRHYFVQEAREETFAAGKNILQKELQRLGITQANHDDIAKQLHLDCAKTLYIALYHQEIKGRDLAQLFRNTPDPTPIKSNKKTIRQADNGHVPVNIMGMTGILTQLSHCCHPAPGDDIVGFITKERGISIHRQQCRQFTHLQSTHPERCIGASWHDRADSQATFEQVYILYLNDKAERVIPRLVALLTQEKITISQMQTLSHRQEEVLQLKIRIRYHYTGRLIALLQKLKGISHLSRE